MIFDRYVAVDWSANNRPKTGKDSIWICNLSADGEPDTANPPTRREAEDEVRGLLSEAVDQGERILIGFDFPYAYPSGFAATLGLHGPPWLAVWQYLATRIQDDHLNNNNRFEVASAINGQLIHHVYWGRPSQPSLDHLSSRRDKVRYRIEGETHGLSEWREVELALRSRGSHPHSTWKLLGAGSVGSQALTGIPVVLRLRSDSHLAATSRVWPFEVKVPELPEGRPAVVHAEIWPSLFRVPSVEGQVTDESQVIGLAQEFRDRDRTGRLRPLFAAAASSSTKEEGWILGVA